jgi:transcriptional regulator with XRE-family HTH domain
MPESFAEKLNRLFKTITKPDGEEFSPEELQVATKGITASYIYRLRSGRSTNPSIDKVKAIADFFGINPSYFFEEEAADPSPDPERMLAHMAHRAHALDMTHLEEMLTMIKAIRESEDVKKKGEEKGE